MTQATAFSAMLDTNSGAPVFAFARPEGWLCAEEAEALPRGPAQTLADRLAPALANLAPRGLVAGAMPFDYRGPDCLWAADRLAQAPVAPACAAPLKARLSEEPSGAAYAAAVAAALALMRGDLRKVVLARSLLVEADAPINIAQLLAHLARDPAATAFAVRLPEGRVLAGASPELLIEKRGAMIASHPLAGSAPRGSGAQDRARAEALARSEKDLLEHGFVTEFILDTLAPLCADLRAPQGTVVTATRKMWHLGTRIEGRLRDPDQPVPLLAAALHPTPAVCGTPPDRAREVIAALEPAPRDYYAGAVGSCDARGDGAWFVSIRCAEIAGARARLFAGAGLVPSSDPEAERAETGAKFRTFLAALGLDTDD